MRNIWLWKSNYWHDEKNARHTKGFSLGREKIILIRFLAINNRYSASLLAITLAVAVRQENRSCLKTRGEFAYQVNAAALMALVDTITCRPCETECLANFRNARFSLVRLARPATRIAVARRSDASRHLVPVGCCSNRVSVVEQEQRAEDVAEPALLPCIRILN
jgi:hypothetical protein